MDKELLDLTKKSGIVFGGKIMGLVLGFVFNFIIARCMGPEVYGRFMYVFSFINFFTIIVISGLPQGLVSYIPQLSDKNKTGCRDNLITSSLLFVFIFAVIMTLVIIINSEFIAEKILNNIELVTLIKWTAPLLIFLSLVQLSQGVFRGIGIIRYYVRGDFIFKHLLNVVCIMLLSYFNLKIYGILITFYISLGSVCFYLLYKIKKMNIITEIKKIEIDLFKAVFKFSFPLLLSGIVYFLVDRTDTFMIGYFLSDKDVGVYNIALKIGTLSSFILVAFETMFAPTISSLYHRNEMDRLANMYRIITRWILTINLISFSIILFFNKDVMHLFGQEFIAGSTALVLISVGQVFNAGVGPVEYINIMTGHTGYALYTNVLVLILNIVLNYFLIPVYGIEGAAFASLVSVGTANIIKLVLVYRDHKMHPYSTDYLIMIASLILSSLIVFIIHKIIVLYWFFNLVFYPIIFLILFLLFNYILGVSETDKSFVDEILGKLRD